jgi:hypothetical protein
LKFILSLFWNALEFFIRKRGGAKKLNFRKKKKEGMKFGVTHWPAPPRATDRADKKIDHFGLETKKGFKTS